MPEITKEEMQTMLEAAAEAGAKKALESVGLHDEQAGRDVNDLRTLIDSWRELKRAALKTVATWATYGVLGLIVFGAWSQLGGKK